MLAVLIPLGHALAVALAIVLIVWEPLLAAPLFALVLLLWQPIVALGVLLTRPMPWPDRRRATVSVFDAAWRGLVMIPVDVLALVVVPFALLQCKRLDEHLPAWAWMWDTEFGVNGDLPADHARYGYHAFGLDPRTYAARLVWLAWRNRATALSTRLGYTYGPGEKADVQTWGDPKTGRDHEGWTVNRRGRHYQVYAVKRLGKVCLRVNYGYKLWAGEGDQHATANVAGVGLSLIGWRGHA